MLWTKEASALSIGYTVSIDRALILNRKNILKIAFAIQVSKPSRVARATAESPCVTAYLTLRHLRGIMFVVKEWLLVLLLELLDTHEVVLSVVLLDGPFRSL